MSDHMEFLTQYLDVRARQIYQKLKDQVREMTQLSEEALNHLGSDDVVRKYVVLEDQTNGLKYRLFLADGVISTAPLDEPPGSDEAPDCDCDCGGDPSSGGSCSCGEDGELADCCSIEDESGVQTESNPLAGVDSIVGPGGTEG